MWPERSEGWSKNKEKVMGVDPRGPLGEIGRRQTDFSKRITGSDLKKILLGSLREAESRN